jgi:hypothetical protein
MSTRRIQDLDQETFTDNEIRRRTFWSCAIMESYAVWVTQPSPSTWLNTATIQLPCREMGFRYGIGVMTKFLEEDNTAYKDRQAMLPEWDFDLNDGEASCYVQVLCFLTKALQWSCAEHQR